MQQLKKTLLVFIPLLFGNLMGANDASLAQLDEQMRDFRYRINIYKECIRGTCPLPQRKAAEITIKKDLAILFSSLALIGAGALGTGLALKYGPKKWHEYSYSRAKAQRNTAWTDFISAPDNSPEQKAAYEKYKLAEEQTEQAAKMKK